VQSEESCSAPQPCAQLPCAGSWELEKELSQVLPSKESGHCWGQRNPGSESNWADYLPFLISPLPDWDTEAPLQLPT